MTEPSKLIIGHLAHTANFHKYNLVFDTNCFKIFVLIGKLEKLIELFTWPSKTEWKRFKIWERFQNVENAPLLLLIIMSGHLTLLRKGFIDYVAENTLQFMSKPKLIHNSTQPQPKITLNENDIAYHPTTTTRAQWFSN